MKRQFKALAVLTLPFSGEIFRCFGPEKLRKRTKRRQAEQWKPGPSTFRGFRSPLFGKPWKLNMSSRRGGSRAPPYTVSHSIEIPSTFATTRCPCCFGPWGGGHLYSYDEVVPMPTLDVQSPPPQKSLAYIIEGTVTKFYDLQKIAFPAV